MQKGNAQIINMLQIYSILKLVKENVGFPFRAIYPVSIQHCLNVNNIQKKLN